jgi:mannose-6-phosphate isomerase class I
MAMELYAGTHEDEILSALTEAFPHCVYDTRQWMKPEGAVRAMTERYMTDDVLFGYVSPLSIEDYFEPSLLSKVKDEIAAKTINGDKMILVGSGASLFAPEDALLVYADMARWEIQQRFRRHEVKALGVDNRQDPVSVQYKRGYFNDWRILDHLKEDLMPEVQFWLYTNMAGDPKMTDSETLRRGMEQTVRGPFRVVPFFDPAPWGGQWMKEVCDLDRSQPNYGWCFDCVPEENSLYLEAEGTLFELPSQDVVLAHSRELLGQQVWARFGKSFPIRFDFLDTMGGGNLSLQVHPTNEFAQKEFGLPYTQDESYYLLDAADNAVVYLGLKEGVDKVQMIEDLRAAQRGEILFDAEKYVNKLPAKKHDHYLIPAGTIHCSGHDSMVLEISSTPSIFTFKLWDWARLGLDGKPRPINVERGKYVIQWDRTTPFVKSQIANHFEVLSDEEGIKEERTGLHPNEFIETRRHTFARPVEHNTRDGVNVLNLVDGEAALIESPEGKFEPFEVHYAETFIIPACIGRYTIKPLQGECMTIKAYVRQTL